MNAKRTIRELENRAYNNDQIVTRLHNEWNRIIVPARDELYKLDGELYRLERDRIDSRADELECLIITAQRQRERALNRIRTIRRMPICKRIWIA